MHNNQPLMDHTYTKDLGSVLVIGGSGFLGFHIVRHFLQERNTSVSVISRNPKRNAIPGASYHIGDISDSSRVHELVLSNPFDLPSLSMQYVLIQRPRVGMPTKESLGMAHVISSQVRLRQLRSKLLFTRPQPLWQPVQSTLIWTRSRL